jgi:hypothetical protein
LRQALQAIRKHVVFLLLEVARLKTVALSRAQYPSAVRSVTKLSRRCCACAAASSRAC